MSETTQPLTNERLGNDDPLALAMSALINEMLRNRPDLIPVDQMDRKHRIPFDAVQRLVNGNIDEIGALLEDIPHNLANGLPLQGHQLRELNRLDPTGTDAQWGEWAMLYERLSGITLETSEAH